MKEICENCHCQKAYTPKTPMPEGYPRLCFNCFIKADGFMFYLQQQLQSGADPIDAMRELWEAADTLTSSTRDSMLHILETMAAYWESVAKAQTPEERPSKITPLRRAKQP